MKKTANCFTIFLCLIFVLYSKTGKAQCSASFNNVINANGNVTFTSTSVTTNTGTLYNWNFGNSTTYTAIGSVTASVTYTANGTYTVILTFTTGTTCVSTATNAIVTVTNVPCGLNANFSYTPGINGQVNFLSTSTSTVAGTTYSWNFGDASAAGAGLSPAHTYTSNGNYTVVLYANNNFTPTCTDSISVPIVVNSICNINPSFTNTNGSNGQVNFTSTSTGTIAGTNFSWQYGDGGTGLGNPSAHTYTANGTYISTLTVINNSATCFTSYTQAVNVSNVSTCSLNANFSYTQGTNGLVNFNSTSTGTAAGTTYSWNFGDASTGNGVATSHGYLANGIYTVTLIANNNFSIACADTAIATINVTSVICNLNANYTHIVSAGGNVNFTNTSSGTNSLTTYLWNFGDGFTSTSQSPSHVYSSAGAFIVRLYVTNNISCLDSVIQSVNVTGISCVANSAFNLVPTATTHVWNVTPSYPYNVVAAKWNWGDNSSSNALYTTHTYSAPGTYSICLSVTVSCGGTSNTCVNQFISKSASENAQMVYINVMPPSATQVGIESQAMLDPELLIYPNPNNGQFEINWNGIHDVVRIKIYNLVGDMVYQADGRSEEIARMIDLKNESDGIYFIRINSGNREITKKMIINK